jgi:sporulation protein YlmC with PRC-barrel domain
MRKIPIASAVMVLAMMTAAASAQTTSPGTSHPSTTTAPAPAKKESAVNPLTTDNVSSIEGTHVYGSDEGKLGYVSIVLMDPQTKKIDRLVVNSGGVLGVGGHRVAIPIEQFSWDADKGGFKLAATEASLKSMPEWVEGATTTGSSTPSKTEKPSAGDGEKTSK